MKSQPQRSDVLKSQLTNEDCEVILAVLRAAYPRVSNPKVKGKILTLIKDFEILTKTFREEGNV